MRKKIKNTSIGLIYVRITVDGIRSEFSITKKCDETQWNSKTGKMIGTKEEAKTVNLFLDTIKATEPPTIKYAPILEIISGN
jgi:hypothetical protein